MMDGVTINNPASQKDRQRVIVHTSVVGVAGNVVLVIFKAIVGVITGSVAIIADALNNLADAMSSIVTLVGTKLAAKAPDYKHPYGYGRIEYLSSVVIAVLILYTGISTLVDSVNRIIHPEAANYDVASVIVIAAGIAVKILLGRFFKARGTSTASEALTASGADAMLDAAVSSSILVGMAIYALWGVTVDGWLGAGIAVVIIKSGIDIMKDSLSSIIGERVPADLSRVIKKTISEYPDVLGAYDLIMNRYGPELTIASVHIQVPDNMDAMQIDKLSREISGTMFQKFGIIMTIGIYAANMTSPIAREMFRKLHELAEDNQEILQVHGFYIDTETRSVSFDMIVRFECTNREAVKDRIIDALKKLYPDYTFTVNLDSDFSD